MQKDQSFNVLKSPAFRQAETRLLCRIHSQNETNPRANLNPGGNPVVAVVVQWVALSQSRQLQAMPWEGILWCLEKGERHESKAMTFLPSAFFKKRRLVENLNLRKKSGIKESN